MFKFQKLKVWEKAVDYTELLHQIEKRIPKKYQFSYAEQLKRANLSITNNIAEGSGRRSKKESSNFFNMSKGSVYETVNIILILSRLNIVKLTNIQSREVYDRADEICRMLGGLIKRR